MTKSKKIILGVGIVNLLIFILFIVIPCNLKFKYLAIENGIGLLILLILTFLPFYLSFFILKIKKIDMRFYIKFVLFCLLSLIYLFLIGALDLYSQFLESRTSNVENYLVLDDGFIEDVGGIFPKHISKNAKNIRYNYFYMDIGSMWDNDYDLYLEIELPEEEYKQEKERIKVIDDFEKIDNGYYSNSSEEYINDYHEYGLDVDSHDGRKYYFVSFFDSENKIIYNLSFGFMKPYFIKINENNIKCESEYCKIYN